MKVASIDVGIVNIGFALLNDSRIVFADKIQLHPKGRGKGKLKEAEIIEKVNKLFFESEIRKFVEESDIVLIENQMSRTNLIIQHVIGALLFGKGKPFKFVRPHDVKRQFDISTGSHYSNKKAAVKYATSRYPDFFSTLAVDKKDDVSDAVLQALYWVEKHVSGESPRINKSVQKKDKKITNLRKNTKVVVKKKAPKKAAAKKPKAKAAKAKHPKSKSKAKPKPTN
jgi:hypothetical protein